MEEIRKRPKPRMCKRTREQIRIWPGILCRLVLRGYPYREIAKRLNDDLAKRKMDYRLTESMVYYDIQKLLISWKRDQLESIDQYVTLELQKLDKMETEAWNAWELSKQKKTKNKTKKAGNGTNGSSDNDRGSDRNDIREPALSWFAAECTAPTRKDVGIWCAN